VRSDQIPSEAAIFARIEEVFGHGVRRPGYPADRWAESWLQERFHEFGLENVRAEPVALPYWEPKRASLTVTTNAETLDIPCFPLPHAAPVAGLEADLVAFDAASPASARGVAALDDVQLTRMPQSVMRNLARWTYDPDGDFDSLTQVLPFGRGIQHVMEPAIEAGAAAFVGTLSGYPGDSRDYYVPYDAVERPIPGVWISGSDGARLRDLIAAGPVRIRLTVESVREPITAYNIVGELPGADSDTVVIGSHHDGPWSSAVEDASGIALVLAQAQYWSQVPQSDRPHRLTFLLNAGHMAGGAGQATFVEQHAAELERAVLEIHLEHAAMEFAERDGRLEATGHPEPRWWFTSDLDRLQATVRSAIEAEDLRRSLVVPPTLFGEKPTTDGSNFYVAGVPIVQFLAAPFYLFDSMDTLDKIHRPTLVPLTRAAIRIVESTAGVSAEQMRRG